MRELANVIERAVITARDGRLDLDRVLPRAGDEPAGLAPAASDRGGIRTARELEDLERENIRRALAASAGKVSGPEGAAERLGLKPSTLSSRMKALGIPGPSSERELPGRAPLRGRPGPSVRGGCAANGRAPLARSRGTASRDLVSPPALR